MVDHRRNGLYHFMSRHGGKRFQPEYVPQNDDPEQLRCNEHYAFIFMIDICRFRTHLGELLGYGAHQKMKDMVIACRVAHYAYICFA